MSPTSHLHFLKSLSSFARSVHCGYRIGLTWDEIQCGH
jgi:hypothetical protein